MGHMTVGAMELQSKQKALITSQLKNTLTKREQLASAALQGMLAGGNNMSAEYLVTKAFNFADLILDAPKQSK